MPPGVTPLPPVRKEQIRVAAGAVAGKRDMVSLEAFFEKLVNIGQGQVQVPAFEMGPGPEKPFRPGMMIHRPVDPAIDFITARSDGRADSRQDIRRTALKFPDHDVNDPGSDFQCGSSPSCMNRANDLPTGIQKKNRDTIGGFDAEGHTGKARHTGITGGLVPVGRRREVFPDHKDLVSVNLVQHQEGAERDAEGAAENVPVFFNPHRVVPLCGGHVQRGKRSLTDPAPAGAEGMG